jgi:small subunit ribosomal protein S15
MARMYSRKKGKSGSTRPERAEKPSWVKYKVEEIEKLIVKYAKTGKKGSEIGMIMRDNYGIPDVKEIIGKTVTQVLEENKLTGELPEDLLNLTKKWIDLNKHLEKNKQDMTAKRGLQLTRSKMNRLIKYYKNHNRLPQDWKVDIKRMEMYVE